MSQFKFAHVNTVHAPPIIHGRPVATAFHFEGDRLVPTAEGSHHPVFVPATGTSQQGITWKPGYKSSEPATVADSTWWRDFDPNIKPARVPGYNSGDWVEGGCKVHGSIVPCATTGTSSEKPQVCFVSITTTSKVAFCGHTEMVLGNYATAFRKRVKPRYKENPGQQRLDAEAVKFNSDLLVKLRALSSAWSDQSAQPSEPDNKQSDVLKELGFATDNLDPNHAGNTG